MTYERKAAKNRGLCKNCAGNLKIRIPDVPTYKKKCKEITNLTVLILNNNFEQTVRENGHTDRVSLIIRSR